MNPIQHVAIIMDGNGRWGLKHKKSRNLGHKAGLNTVEKIIKETIKNKIKYLTLLLFLQKMEKTKKKISYLFNLLEEFLTKKIENLNKNKIRFKLIGNKKKSSRLKNIILKKSEQITKKNKRLQIRLLLHGSKR